MSYCDTYCDTYNHPIPTVPVLILLALRETEQRSDMKLEAVARCYASFPEEIGIKIGNVTYRSVSQQSVAVRSST